jgi:hypothetical protein
MQAALINRTRLIQLALVAIFSAPLLAHIVNSQAARLLADDYCFWYNAITKGWWGAMQDQYNNWSGTYSSTAIQSAVALLGIGFLQILPTLFILTWLGGAIWAVYELGMLSGIRSPRFIACFGGALLVFVTLDGASNVFQSLYWSSGSATYITPLVLSMFFVAILFRAIRCPPKDITLAGVSLTSAILAFLIGGFSPIVAPLQVVALLLAIGAVWRLAPSASKRATLTILVIALISAIIAAIILVAAPGNTMREAKFQRPSMPMVGIITLWSTASFVSTSMLIFSPMAILCALVFPGVIAYGWKPLDSRHQSYVKKHALRLLLFITLLTLGLLAVCFAITAYSISDIPPARAMIIPQFILVHGVAAWGIIMGLSLQEPSSQIRSPSRIVILTCAALLIFGPVASAVRTIAVMPNFRTFAEQWDHRDQLIRAATAKGTTDLTVAPFSVDLADYMDVDPIGSDPLDSTNVCAARYYQLRSLRTS